MTSWLSEMNPALLIPIIPILGGVLIALTAILCTQWRRLRQAEFETNLKLEMLNRGFSAEEIERVIKASKSHN